MYFKDGDSKTYSVTIDDTSVASCESKGNRLVFKGLAAGQTSASVKCSDGSSQNFTITVRNTANSNGWL
jgi:hypothetical protein